MKPDFFKNLPLEIITDILLRLPIRSIGISKCVCKAWLDLLETDGFVKSHFSRSAPALVVVGKSGRLKVLELESELDIDLESHEPLTMYDLLYPYQGRIGSSANGLLVVRRIVDLSVRVAVDPRMRVAVDPRMRVDNLFVCNPMTREAIMLDLPSEIPATEVSAYGFGASKITGQYKAVCISLKSCVNGKLECHVYTLGTGSWRRVEGNRYTYHWVSGAFVNGNLHWRIKVGEEEEETGLWISCFDVETECFSFLKSPHNPQGLPFITRRSVSALSGCLCYCEESAVYENEPGRYELTIWIMKEYGVDESWSMEYVIPLEGCMDYVDPIKVFKNGDLLMKYFRDFFYYSKKNKTMQRIDLFGAGEASDRVVDFGLFTPTLVSLKILGLGMENVISF